MSNSDTQATQNSNRFHDVRKGDRFFKAVWKASLGTDFMNGRDAAEAFNHHGYGGGALAALDFHAEIFPCFNCDFIGDNRQDLGAHQKETGHRAKSPR